MIRAKRLLEMKSAKHGLDDRTKINASFFDYSDQVTASKASGSKFNYSIWNTTETALPDFNYSFLRFEKPKFLVRAVIAIHKALLPEYKIGKYR